MIKHMDIPFKQINDITLYKNKIFSLLSKPYKIPLRRLNYWDFLDIQTKINLKKLQ